MLQVHVYDFDDFMRIPPCCTGRHTPSVRLVKREEVEGMCPPCSEQVDVNEMD